MNFSLDEKLKKIIIHKKPLIEILHLSTEMEYYDVRNGTFNRFSTEELDQIKEEARKFMIEKINNSDLPKLALDQGDEGLKFIEQTSKDLGWKMEKNSF